MSDRASRTDILLFLGLLALAALSRVFGPSSWHLMADEYYTYFGAAKDATSLVNPSYYALTLFSFQLFGESEWAARIPALVMGVLAIPVFWFTWRRVIGRNAALVSALLVMLSSWHLWYSQQARFYSAVFLFGSLAFYYLYRSITEDKVRLLAFGLLAGIVAASFHLTAVLVLAAFGVYCLAMLFSRDAKNVNSARIAKVYMGLCVAAGLAASPFLLGIAGQWMGSGEAWGYGPVAFALQSVKYVQLPIAVCAAFGLVALLVNERWKGIYFLVAAGFPIAVAVVLSAVFSVRPDYVFYTLPMIIALAGVCCEEARAALSGKVTAHALLAVVVVSLLPEFASNFTGRASLDVRDTLAYVDEHYEPGDRVMSFVGGFNYYTERTHELVRIPGNPYDGSVDWTEELAQRLEPDSRLWIVLPVSRDLPARGLNRWLLENARLRWRDVASRYDYTHRGYEVFLVAPE